VVVRPRSVPVRRSVDPVTTRRFPFAFARAHRVAALPFLVLPSTTWVEVDEKRIRARFGVWTLDTPRSNVKDVTTTGGYSFIRTAGPAMADAAASPAIWAHGGVARLVLAGACRRPVRWR
jgi:hypothetical protein